MCAVLMSSSTDIHFYLLLSARLPVNITRKSNLACILITTKDYSLQSLASVQQFLYFLHQLLNRRYGFFFIRVFIVFSCASGWLRTTRWSFWDPPSSRYCGSSSWPSSPFTSLRASFTTPRYGIADEVLSASAVL